MPSVNTILLELTNRCHRNCRHCAVSAGQEGTEHSLPSYVVQQAAEIGVRRIDLTGGEPMLSPTFFATLAEIANAGITLSVCSTTGDLLDECAIRRIRSALSYLPVFCISLDGCDAVSGDYLRGAGAAKSAMNTIDRLGEFGAEVWVVTVLHTHNARSLLQILKWIEARNWITRWKISPCRPSGRAAESGELFPSSIQEFIVDIARVAQSDSLPIRIKIADLFKYNWLYESETYAASEHPCKYLGETLTISPSGEVAPCPPGLESGYSLFRFGNIHRECLREIVNGSRYSRFRMVTIRDFETCASCALLEICGGGCRALACLSGKGIKGCDLVSMDRAKRIHEGLGSKCGG